MGIPPKPLFKTIDGKDFYGYERSLALDKIYEFSNFIIYKTIGLDKDELNWKHGFASYCSYGGVVRRNTNDTLDFFKKGKHEHDMCPLCRGKGHHWKCEVWNGKPYHLDNNKKWNWNCPAKCEECDGIGVIWKFQDL